MNKASCPDCTCECCGCKCAYLSMLALTQKLIHLHVCPEQAASVAADFVIAQCCQNCPATPADLKIKVGTPPAA